MMLFVLAACRVDEVKFEGEDTGSSPPSTPPAAPSGTRGAVEAARASFVGERAGDDARYLVHGGDVDGDGVNDLVFGAASNDEGGADKGRVYVYPDPVFRGANDLGDAPATIVGDGNAPYLAARARIYDPGGGQTASLAIRHGNGLSLCHGPWIGDVEATDCSIQFDVGAIQEVAVGDLDGDGAPDLAVTLYDHDGEGHNAIAIFAGPFSPTTAVPSPAFLGTTEDDADGYSLVADSDLDGDGLGDLLVSERGGAAVVLGPLPEGDVTLGVVADLEVSGARNARYANAGDVDGDGYDDLLVGRYGAGEGGHESGKATLLAGPITGDVSEDDGVAWVVGPDIGDRAGCAVDGDEDIDDDGLADVLIGACYSDVSASNAGAVALFYGPVSGSRSVLDGDAVFLGELEEDTLGNEVAMVGDVDGDGFGDLAFSAPGNDEAGLAAGKIYVVGGGPR